MMRDHRKLRAFELADQLALSVYASTKDFPRDEMFGLVAQIRRAAVSAASNIVEGCARNSLADYLRFLDMAYGSVREVEYQISLASRLGYLKVKGSQSWPLRHRESSTDSFVRCGLPRSLLQPKVSSLQS